MTEAACTHTGLLRSSGDAAPASPAQEPARRWVHEPRQNRAWQSPEPAAGAKILIQQRPPATPAWSSSWLRHAAGPRGTGGDRDRHNRGSAATQGAPSPATSGGAGAEAPLGFKFLAAKKEEPARTSREIPHPDFGIFSWKKPSPLLLRALVSARYCSCNTRLQKCVILAGALGSDVDS